MTIGRFLTRCDDCKYLGYREGGDDSCSIVYMPYCLVRGKKTSWKEAHKRCLGPIEGAYDETLKGNVKKAFKSYHHDYFIFRQNLDKRKEDD
jgi:hypothetical protein